jgi:hypothetical protein
MRHHRRLAGDLADDFADALAEDLVQDEVLGGHGLELPVRLCSSGAIRVRMSSAL